MVTKIPPEKSRIRPAFLVGFREDFQSMGIGIVSRYRSVRTFNTTVTKMSTLEMAGWQKSAPCQMHAKWMRVADLLPGSGYICQFLERGLQLKRIDSKTASQVDAMRPNPA